MAINPMGTIPLDMFEKQQELSRQQRMAQALMQQGQQIPQGQMVSGRFVPTSFFQNITPLVQTYLGTRMSEQADKQALDLAKQIRQIYGDELQQFRKIEQGTPAVEGGIYGADNKLTMQTTPDMFNENMELNPQYRQVAPVAAVAPNRQGAYDFASRASNPILQQIGAKRLTEGPMKVGVDDTLIDPITKQVIFQGAGKPPTPTEDIKNYQFLKEQNQLPKGMTLLGYQTYIKQAGKETDNSLNLPTVNNNGLPVGRFDKTGRYISPQGRVYPASAITEAQKEHDVTMDLAFKLDNLTKGDIKNAFGSVMDYTGSKAGQMIGRKNVVDAQNKINSIQIKNVLDNLSQLKGASSDKEMAQMIKDFPAYTADPEIMEKWTDRASKTANRFLKRSEQRFGFDTEYAQEDRFKKEEKPKTKSATQTNSTGQPKFLGFE